jgi:acyl-CoA thioester hydrolase
MTDRIGQHLAGFPVVLRLPVQWGDMDAYGHLNNTIFFRYFESARVDYLERCGFARSWEVDRIGAILHSTACRVREPLFYPDTVSVGGRCSHLEEDRFTMEYRIVSESSGRLAAEGVGVVVSYDYETGAKTAIPAGVRVGIERLEGRVDD